MAEASPNFTHNRTKTFTWKARDAGGRLRRGRIEARDNADALGQLTAQRLVVIELKAVTAVERKARVRKRISQQDRISLFTELASLLSAGVSLGEALPSLVEAYQESPLGAPLAEVARSVQGGASLASALSASSLRLPEYVHSVIQAGEASGHLAAALGDIADQLGEDHRAMRELRNALVYPAVLVFSGLAAVTIIFVAVVPRFARLLKSGNADMPAFSRWVIESGLWLQNNFLLALVGAAMFVGGLLLLWRQPLVRQLLIDSVSRAPVLGSWLRARDVARWSGLMATVLNHRVSLLEATELAAPMVASPNMRTRLQGLAPLLRQGQAFSEALKTTGFIAPLRLNLIRVGERAGNLPEMLGKLAGMSREEATARQKNLLTLIEPIAILLIGLAVGAMMVAVMMAVTSLNAGVI